MKPGILRDIRPTSGTALGVHVSFACPELIELHGLLGFHWLFLDAEHTPLTAHAARELVRAADVVNMSCLVRVPKIDAAIIESYLDIGVVGVLAPNVSTVADAQSLVSAVKYSPQGKRGAASKSRSAHYGQSQTAAEYFRQSNQLTFTVALIESQAGIDELEGIMAVPGLDCVAIGANDLGLALGSDRGMADPAVRTLVERTQQRIKAFGKRQLAVVADAREARAAVESGTALVAVPDVTLMADAGRAYLEIARKGALVNATRAPQ